MKTVSLKVRDTYKVASVIADLNLEETETVLDSVASIITAGHDVASSDMKEIIHAELSRKHSSETKALLLSHSKAITDLKDNLSSQLTDSKNINETLSNKLEQIKKRHWDILELERKGFTETMETTQKFLKQGYSIKIEQLTLFFLTGLNCQIVKSTIIESLI
jgi:hypothetical protein